MTVRLGVNIDHIATLRQVRGNTTSYPDLLRAAEIAASNGADQITIHLREDRRHIQDQDVIDLCQSRPCPINLEMATNEEIFQLALDHKPDWVCFVPEKREELTTEGGLDVAANMDTYISMISELKAKGIRSSMFIEPDEKQIMASKEVGADAVEFHTGKWVLLSDDAKDKEWQRLLTAAELTKSLGLNVHAGHGLDYQTTKEIMALPHLEELNIGHSIVCYSVFESLSKVVENFKDILNQKT